MSATGDSFVRCYRLRHREAEERDWWDREGTVEGWAPESTLVRALAENNAAPVDDLLVAPDQRQLAEDMVLLQVLNDEEPWNQAAAAYDHGRGDLPDLTGLAQAEGSRWIDLTKLARRTTITTATSSASWTNSGTTYALSGIVASAPTPSRTTTFSRT